MIESYIVRIMLFIIFSIANANGMDQQRKVIPIENASGRLLLVRSSKHKQQKNVGLSSEKWERDKAKQSAKDEKERKECIKHWDEHHEDIWFKIKAELNYLAFTFSQNDNVIQNHEKALDVLKQFWTVEVDPGHNEEVDEDWNAIIETLRDDTIRKIEFVEEAYNISIPDAVRNVFWKYLLLETKRRVEITGIVIQESKGRFLLDLCLLLVILLVVLFALNYYARNLL